MKTEFEQILFLEMCQNIASKKTTTINYWSKNFIKKISTYFFLNIENMF